MPKLLYVGDYGKTGFGIVANGLLTGLHKRGWEILHLAINYNDLEPADVPWKMIPAGFYAPQPNGQYEAADPYGTIKINSWVKSFDPDVTLLNNDFPVVVRYLGNNKELSEFAKHRCKKVIYSPVDSWPFSAQFYNATLFWDEVVSYTYWQKEMMCSVDEDRFKDMPVVYHGIDLETYFPIDKQEAKRELSNVFQKYNRDAKIPTFTDAYLVYFVGTNQWRKDIPVLFKGYMQFRNQFPNNKMYLIPHTNALPMSPNHGGWSLHNLRDLTGLRDAVIMQYANIFNEEEMNIFYNAADVLAYPTRGEGFGLPSLEAMATKTPVIATRFGPQYEIHADGRGFFIDVDDYEPGNMSAVSYFAKPSWRSLGQQLSYVYQHPEEAAETAERAYSWVTKHSWDSKADQMHNILTEVLSRPDKDRPIIERRANRAERRASKRKRK